MKPDHENLKSLPSKKLLIPLLVVFLILFAFTEFGFTQKIAVVTPQESKLSEKFSAKLSKNLSSIFDVIDSSLADSIFKVKRFESPFNLSTLEAKRFGASVGCNYFVLIKSDTLRRSDFERIRYYESYVTIYLVSARTGRLIFWKLKKIEETSPGKSEENLLSTVNQHSKELRREVLAADKKELNEITVSISEVPDVDSPEAKTVRPPLPFKRLKPKYTGLASFYDVTATVDILADIDENGKVTRTEIVRWAGYGLDDSVTETVESMNWRPAEKNLRPIPMRVLLRYNFKNIESE